MSNEKQTVNEFLTTMQTFIDSCSRDSEKIEREYKARKVNESALCAYFYRIKVCHALIDEQTKRLYHIVDKFDKQIVPMALNDAGVELIAVPEVKRSFYIVRRYSASMVDKEQALKWLRSVKMQSMISLTVNSSALATFLKDRLVNHGEDPPECVKLNSYDMTGMSKYTPKEKKRK